MNIILCGLPMSGKTTVGKILADKLCRDFIDLDRSMEKTYFAQSGEQLSNRQVYIKLGEERFRELEKREIGKLKEVQSCVIALGGGSLNDPENIKILSSIGQIFYLETPLKKLWERVHWRHMPVYLDKMNPELAFYEIAKKRIPIYESAANHIVNTELLNENEVAKIILQRCKEMQ